MTDTLTESFCERCGTRYEFEAPTRLNPLRKTRGFIGGLKNYLTSQDDMSDAMRDAMRQQEEALASAQLEAFHESFNFCIDCRQYTCVNCWNDGAGRCRSCAPIPGTDDLAERLAASVAGNGSVAVAEPTLAEDEIQRRLGMDAWPTSDLPEHVHTNGHRADLAWPDTDAVDEPIIADYEPEREPAAAEFVPEPEPEPVVAEVEPEPEPEPVVAEFVPEPEPQPEPEPMVAEPEPEPVVAEFEPEPEPEPVVAEFEPEAEPFIAEIEPEPEAEPVVAQAEPTPEPFVAEIEPEPEPVAAQIDARPYEPWIEPEPVVGEAEPEFEPEPEPVVAEADEAMPALRVVGWEPDTAYDVFTDEPVLAEGEPEPVVAEVEPEPEPVVAEVEPEPEPVIAEVEPEPEPVIAEVEPEPEPVTAEVEPEPEPTPARRPMAPIGDTILRFPGRQTDAPAERQAAEDESPEVAARRAQLDLLGLGDPGEGPVEQTRPAVLPYRSRGAAAGSGQLSTRATQAGGSTFWEASAREVAGAAANIGVQACGQCGLSLSANARFCRRCGTRQAQSA